MSKSRSHKQQTRNYADEYANYQGTPDQIKNRGLRNAARREYEQANGNLPADQDVDHLRPLVKGGSNDLSNLRATSVSANRSFKRTRKAGME